MPLKDATISINGLTYPCTDWALVEEGERLERRWDKGFSRGMGQYRDFDSERFFFVRDLDTTLPPYIRLGLGSRASFNSLTGFSSAAPLYVFLVQAGDETFVYVLSGRRGYKLKLADNSVEDEHDFGANAACGRPALFEGKWYIPLGADVDAVELTTINSTGADTFNTLNVRALAFANLMKDGIAQLARAHTINNVDLASAVTRAALDWSGGDVEVGDSSLSILDMVTWKNELAIMKSDSVYRFDIDGASSSMQDFVGRTITPGVNFDGQGFAHGPYLYWAHSTGLWRFVEDKAMSIGPEAAMDYVGITQASGRLDSVDAPVADFQWKSVVAWGRWLYACSGTTAFYGEIMNDGKVRWHGELPMDSGSAEHLGITEGGALIAGHPLLWVADTSNNVVVYSLEPDGSLRSGLGDTTNSRGPIGLNGYLFTSRTDLAGGRLRHKLKQLRRMWVRTEEEQVGGWSANATLQLRSIRDNIVAGEDVGATITSSGFFERLPTPGTTDTFYEIRMELKVVITSVVASDARIVDFGMEAVTASIYLAKLTLTPTSVKGHRSVRTMLKELRDLKNGKMIVVRDPENPSSTFNAQIVGVAETAVDAGAGQVGYTVEVRMELFDRGKGV